MLIPFFLNRLDELLCRMLIQRPRFGTVSFNWSSDGHRYTLPRTSINLSRKFKRRLHHFLAACEVRKSTIRNAGTGVFLMESVQKDQIMFKYGGRRISFPEADRLSKMVRDCCAVYRRQIHVFMALTSSTLSTGIGYAHQGKYNACVLLWLKAKQRDEDGMVRAEPSCWRISQLQRESTVQR